MDKQEAAPSESWAEITQSRTQIVGTHLTTDGNYSSSEDVDENNEYQSSYGGSTTYNEDDDDQDTTGYNSRSEASGMDETTKDLTRAETRWVQYVRLLIVVMLIGSTAIASFLTFRILSKNEQNKFRENFDEYASQIIEESTDNLKATFETFHFLSSTLSTTSYDSENPEDKLPFLTLSNFEILGRQTIVTTGSLLVSFSPLINNSALVEWENYSISNQQWIRKSLNIDAAMSGTSDLQAVNITPFVFQISSTSSNGPVEITPVPDNQDAYSPVWQTSPPPLSFPNLINYDLLSRALIQIMMSVVDRTRMAMFSEMEAEPETLFVNKTEIAINGPNILMVTPVFQNILIESSMIEGHIMTVIPWYVLYQGILKSGQNGIVLVIKQSCGDSAFTWQINGANVVYLGTGDLHDVQYNSLVQSYTLSRFAAGNISLDMSSNLTCSYTISIYPTQVLEDEFTTRQPLYVTLGVIVVFCFTSLMFLLYDAVVQYRQSKLLALATKTSSIVSSLFPAQVRDQLFGRLSTIGVDRRRPIADEESVGGSVTSLTSGRKKSRKHAKKKKKSKSRSVRSCSSDNVDDDDDLQLDSRPIADLFPHATVLFGDIAGFTAWSSTREPCQVFVLLETIYRAFDKIAKQRRVFKVETIGDCYVAVVGLPDPCKDHAIVMARFARDILEKLNQLTHKLESTLGPDTGDLNMRIGCHSGPVTAGVLRGERARFQLFGDTVNTAARMESTGMKNRIQVSQETADLIISGGKANWVELREDLVHAKGKGELQTYWLKHKAENKEGELTQASETGSVSDGSEATDINLLGENLDIDLNGTSRDERLQRMVDWNADILNKLLQRILATRAAVGARKATPDSKLRTMESQTAQIGYCMQDVVEVIELPKFDEALYEFDPDSITVSDKVTKQLRKYVSLIASMYRNNPFHNFEHASHVTMSTVKLLSRIVAPTPELSEEDEMENKDLHDYTYGITSDPLTQFAVVFSALIHDVDHKGVPNFLLCKEDVTLAAVYQGQSVAEQNSIDVSWCLLMDPMFKDLRRAIYTTEDEMKRFRRLVVNSVMATDIFDKELSALRKNRWSKAFDGNTSMSDTARCRKATIVIEHLIQASDVSHTMQHWHVYQKWNERLFREMYGAHVSGRWEKDPTENWFQGELNFFDGYIIPLAKKLKECGVFGVSSDEYLNYAEKNRSEWERKGQEVVATMREKYCKINTDMMELAKLDQALHNFSKS